MGCGSSKQQRLVEDGHGPSNYPPSNHASSASNGGQSTRQNKHDEPMTSAEIESRIECIDQTKMITIGGVTVRYAYLSQRGYYPDDPNKANQDAFSITHAFGGQPADSLFSVYDGHGRDGDHCAHFARDHLPQTIEKYFSKAKNRELKLLEAKKQKGSDAPPGEASIELTKDQVHSACMKAHVECNRAMHRAQELDDSLSGTTSISVVMHGRRNRITVCNVGDSRAIIGQYTKPTDGKHSKGGVTASNLKAMPLSRDQTPYRRDERIRIKATGARILSLDQIEGLEPIGPDDEDEEGSGELELGEELDEGGDPPRVWSPHGEYPGTAFTRSLGDAIAEELGVFAEPEMLTRPVTRDDKIIVIASDGVFEFLTNQSVIDICAKFSDPLEACRAVVAESYELWLQYELRTDDITMICMFVDDVNDDFGLMESFSSSRQDFSGEPSVPDFHMSINIQEDGEAIDDEVDDVVPTEGLRPVRAHMSKEKSKHIQQMKIKMMASDSEMDVSSMENFDLSKLYTEKTEQEKSRIAEAIRASVMFQNITDEQREMIFGVMESIPVEKGAWVIKQGTVGDRFYIVDNGRFEVRIVPDGEQDKEGRGGNVVHIYEGSHEKHAHPSFGELALMYSAPRAASIIAQTDGHLWALHRYAFRQVLSQQSGRQELARALGSIDIFKKLSRDDIKSLSAAMDEVTFGRGEKIMVQDASGSHLYVIKTGACEYTERLDVGVHNKQLKSGDYFGAEVLVEQKTNRASVLALQTTCCWRLDKSTMKGIVGSLKPKSRRSSDNVA